MNQFIAGLPTEGNEVRIIQRKERQLEKEISLEPEKGKITRKRRNESKKKREKGNVYLHFHVQQG